MSWIYTRLLSPPTKAGNVLCVRCAWWVSLVLHIGLIFALQFADFLRQCFSHQTTSRTISFSISNSFFALLCSKSLCWTQVSERFLELKHMYMCQVGHFLFFADPTSHAHLTFFGVRILKGIFQKNALQRILSWHTSLDFIGGPALLNGEFVGHVRLWTWPAYAQTKCLLKSGGCYFLWLGQVLYQWRFVVHEIVYNEMCMFSSVFRIVRLVSVFSSGSDVTPATPSSPPVTTGGRLQQNERYDIFRA